MDSNLAREAWNGPLNQENKYPKPKFLKITKKKKLINDKSLMVDFLCH